jgi:DNA-binding response OmpR family regulator/GGDEF domain-containing protein
VTSVGESLGRPRLLLTGDATARPDGLERALTRAGFAIGEAPGAPHEIPPDAILTTLPDADAARLRQVLAVAAEEPPRVILFAADDRDAPAAALALGAADALASPVHLPDLCARLVARIRERQAPFRTPHEARIRDSLRELIGEARSPLQPEEVALALVRRLGRALQLTHCAFVLTRPGEDRGRVIAMQNESRPERTHLDLTQYPEIEEAIRSRRALAVADTHAGAGSPTTVVPVVVDDAVSGVLLLRGQDSAPVLSATQLGLAASLAEAAARALEAGSVRNGGPPPTAAPALDRRLQEELERARRYSLSLSLVLLDVEPPPGSDPADLDARDRHRQDTSGEIRRALRLPDFVSGYGDGAFALVLPETAADGARRSVLRLRDRLVSGSAGIAAYPHPAVTTPDDLFVLVEAALRRGRAQSGERIGIAD